jgi:hypothetical protein
MRMKDCGPLSAYVPHYIETYSINGTGKAFLVTGRGSLQDCETSRIPHLLDNWVTDGSEVASFAHWQPFTPRKIPGTHFC